MSTAVEFCKKQGKDIATDPNTRIDDDLYLLLAKEFNKDMALKLEAERQAQERQEREVLKSVAVDEPKKPEHIPTEVAKPKVVGKIELDPEKKKAEEAAKKAAEEAAKKAAEEAAKLAAKHAAEKKAAEEAAAKAAAEKAAKQAAENEVVAKDKETESTQEPAKDEEVFRLNKPVLKNAPKVVGKIDLSSINPATSFGKA